MQVVNHSAWQQAIKDEIMNFDRAQSKEWW